MADITSDSIESASGPQGSADHRKATQLYQQARDLAGRNELAAALDTLGLAIDCAPAWPEPWAKAAELRLQDADVEGAVAAARRAIDVGSDRPVMLIRVAEVLRQAGRMPEAARVLRHVLMSRPRDVAALSTLGQVNLSLGNFPEALMQMERAVQLAPKRPAVQHGLGNVYYRMGDYEQALAAYHRAIALAPGNQKYIWTLSNVHLMRGEYERGWTAQEARFGLKPYTSELKNTYERIWDARPLAGRRLLLRAEQGIGDTLQFIRYLPLLRKQIGDEEFIGLVCDARIAPIVGTVEGWDEIYEMGSGGVIPYDVQLPLLSLPHRFGTTLDSIPANIPYIRLPGPTNIKVERPAGARLAVGIAWAGNPLHAEDSTRSCGIEYFADLFDLEDVCFYSLQYGERAGDIAPWRERDNVADLSHAIGPFSELLAAIDQLDLVITVDTSTCHLAGAYGKPVWTLLQYGGEWRWLVDRTDSPWYPTMRLFRQRIVNDWTPVIAEVRAALGELLR